MARRGTRSEQYFQIAAYYGIELVENLHNPHVPEFVIVHAARRAAHYALTALSLEEKQTTGANLRPAFVPPPGAATFGLP